MGKKHDSQYANFGWLPIILFFCKGKQQRKYKNYKFTSNNYNLQSPYNSSQPIQFFQLLLFVFY